MEDSDYTKPSSARAYKESDNKKINFIFPNVIPHTEKSVVSFNSEGYDRDTHIQP